MFPYNQNAVLLPDNSGSSDLGKSGKKSAASGEGGHSEGKSNCLSVLKSVSFHTHLYSYTALLVITTEGDGGVLQSEGDPGGDLRGDLGCGGLKCGDPGGGDLRCGDP